MCHWPTKPPRLSRHAGTHSDFAPLPATEHASRPLAWQLPDTLKCLEPQGTANHRRHDNSSLSKQCRRTRAKAMALDRTFVSVQQPQPTTQKTQKKPRGCMRCQLSVHPHRIFISWVPLAAAAAATLPDGCCWKLPPALLPLPLLLLLPPMLPALLPYALLRASKLLYCAP